MDSNPHSPPHSGFFASTLQKTKHNFTKFSNKALQFNHNKDKDKSMLNGSININNSKRSSATLNPSTSYSATNLAEILNSTASNSSSSTSINTSSDKINKFGIINSSNKYSTHPNHKSTDNINTKSLKENKNDLQFDKVILKRRSKQ